MSNKESTSIEELHGRYPDQKGGPITEEDLAGEVWGIDIDSYPLRDKDEDPKWAINTMKV